MWKIPHFLFWCSSKMKFFASLNKKLKKITRLYEKKEKLIAIFLRNINNSDRKEIRGRSVTAFRLSTFIFCVMCHHMCYCCENISSWLFEKSPIINFFSREIRFWNVLEAITGFLLSPHDNLLLWIIWLVKGLMIVILKRMWN